MGKGFGIASLVIAIIGIFIPIAGVFIGWIALMLATVAALAGELPLTIAVVIISIVNYIFFSPSLWIGTLGANLNAGPGSPNIAVYVTVVLIIAPIVGLILNRSGKAVIGSR